MIPILIIINEHLVVVESYVCRDAADLEDLFKQELSDRGVEVTPDQMDDGIVTLKCGTSVIMNWARPSNEHGVPKVGETTAVWCCQCDAMVDAEVTEVVLPSVAYICENNHKFKHL